MLPRDALWMQNVPEVLLREEELILSLINGILCTWLLLSGPPVRGDRSLQSGRRDQNNGKNRAQRRPRGRALFCSPHGWSPVGRPSQGGHSRDGGVKAPSSSHSGSFWVLTGRQSGRKSPSVNSLGNRKSLGLNLASPPSACATLGQINFCEPQCLHL